MVSLMFGFIADASTSAITTPEIAEALTALEKTTTAAAAARVLAAAASAGNRELALRLGRSLSQSDARIACELALGAIPRMEGLGRDVFVFPSPDGEGAHVVVTNAHALERVAKMPKATRTSILGLSLDFYGSSPIAKAESAQAKELLGGLAGVLPNLVALSLSEVSLGAAGGSVLSAITGLRHLDLSSTGAATPQFLKKLASADTLETLSLAVEPVKDAGAAVIAVRFSALAALTLRWCELTSKGAAAVAQLPTLRSLDLTQNALGAAASKAFAKASVEHLFLDNCQLTDKGFDGIGKLQSLRTLSVKNNKLTASSVKILKGLTALETLNVSMNRFADAIKAFPILPQLRHLDVSFVGFGAPGLAAILELTKLRSLELQGNSVWEAETRLLPRLKELQRLNLYGARVDGTALAKLQQLRVLLVKDAKLTAPGLTAIAELPHLLELDARGGDVGAAFESLAQLRSLARLWCSDTRIAGPALHAVATRTRLSELGLTNCDFGPKHCGALAGASGLQRVDVSFNGAIANSAGDVAKLPLLHTLHAKACGITDTAVAALASTPSLQDLALDGNPLTDGAVPKLRAADGLRQLGISETEITKAGVRELRSSLPTCNVVV